MNCNDCSRTMHHRDVWRALPIAERRVLSSEHTMFAGRGLCHGCYSRAQRNGTIVDHELAARPWAHVLEDWRRLADRNLSRLANVQRIAPRIGMTVEALERAVTRHREDVAA